jgi:hypothetical protein
MCIWLTRTQHPSHDILSRAAQEESLVILLLALPLIFRLSADTSVWLQVFRGLFGSALLGGNVISYGRMHNGFRWTGEGNTGRDE